MTEGTRRSSGITLAAPWLKGELAKQVEYQTQTDLPVTLQEKTEVLYQVLHIIHRDSLQPVVVFDDADR